MVEEVEERICCVYNTGKQQLDNLRAEQTKKLADEQQRKIESEVKKLSTNDDMAIAIENERVKRDITMQLKFTAEEQEKVRKDKAAKQARIEAYLKEMERQKELENRMKEEKRLETAQRYKNEEISCMFNAAKREERNRQLLAVRTQLNQQIEENKRQQKAQKQGIRTCSDDALEKEHKFFFGYARNLMEDAQQKGRPLYPFVKVVNQYKRENQIDCDRKIAKHLLSNVPIGDKQQYNVQNQKEKEKKNSIRESVLENYLKIEEIVKAESEACKAENSDNTIPKDDCTSQLRYSMEELKKMNQFSAPTCH